MCMCEEVWGTPESRWPPKDGLTFTSSFISLHVAIFYSRNNDSNFPISIFKTTHLVLIKRKYLLRLPLKIWVKYGTVLASAGRQNTATGSVTWQRQSSVGWSAYSCWDLCALAVTWCNTGTSRHTVATKWQAHPSRQVGSPQNFPQSQQMEQKCRTETSPLVCFLWITPLPCTPAALVKKVKISWFRGGKFKCLLQADREMAHIFHTTDLSEFLGSLDINRMQNA